MQTIKLAGFDIGGTKCAAIIGVANELGEIDILQRKQIETPKNTNPYTVLDMLCDAISDSISDISFTPIPMARRTSTHLMCSSCFSVYLRL